MGQAAQDAYESETGFSGDELYPKPRKFHECEHCGKEFKKAIGLADHVRMVHPDKNI